MSDLTENIRARLIELMAQRRIRPTPLARRAGLSESAVHDILHRRSKNPGVNTLQAIARALDTPLTALFETPGVSGARIADAEEIGDSQ